MGENNGKIYADINRLPQVSFEAAAEILPIIKTAAKEFPHISQYYVSSEAHIGSGNFRYQQYVQDVQKWQKKWLGAGKLK